jgi:SAM-dependent methyltransferase
MDRLSLTREFWNETPCDGQAAYASRAQFRYGKEPWLLPALERIAATHRHILEVGCGQGTDGVTLCCLLPPGSEYVGVDLSEASLLNARHAAGEMTAHLHVEARFQLENAERLSFLPGRFDAVVSVGALHHSPDTARAVSEVHRVLQPGGVAYVCLYRMLSPKLLGSHALRGVQRTLDAVLRTERVLYRAARAAGLQGGPFGTMIDECFGVPILRSYTRRGMQALFGNFSSVRLRAYGVGFPPAGAFSALDRLPSNPLGYLWLAEAKK